MDILELLEDAKLFFEKVEELLNIFFNFFRNPGKMLQFQKEAMQILEQYPTSPYKDALILMVNYVIDRKI